MFTSTNLTLFQELTTQVTSLIKLLNPLLAKMLEGKIRFSFLAKESNINILHYSLVIPFNVDIQPCT